MRGRGGQCVGGAGSASAGRSGVRSSLPVWVLPARIDVTELSLTAPAASALAHAASRRSGPSRLPRLISPRQER